jgi:desulfoferrodoxin (superoxide reductase-like protein)
MRVCWKSIKGWLSLGLFLLVPGIAFANKASVYIEAPKTATKGQEVIIVLKVNHSENTPTHYVNWVEIRFNGKPMKRWEYTQDKRPESNDFVIRYKYIVNMDTKVSAEANCNLHGSAGPDNSVVRAK